MPVVAVATDLSTEMPEPPEITQEQRKLGYVSSLALRRRRAVLKKFLATGKSSMPERLALVMKAPSAQGMKVYSLVRALPYIGPTKAAKLLEAAGIDRDRTVRALGPKQREKLLELLEARN